jgi:3-deoxy-D-manno-octulosonate 8-phosphate phosphatase (KDO 8-P phosphatase)
MDVDGTLTDGNMILLGNTQLKIFNVHDGLGIRVAEEAGLKIAWVTGNVTQAVEERGRMLGLEDIYQNARNKAITINELAKKYNISTNEIAFIGDDINDIPAMKACGYGIAVLNAVDEVKDAADYITKRRGGEGAVREIIETLLKAQNRWEEAMAIFMKKLELEQVSLTGPEAVN